MAIHAVYCTRGDDGIYIMQHYYHRLATYCMYVDMYSYQLHRLIFTCHNIYNCQYDF